MALSGTLQCKPAFFGKENAFANCKIMQMLGFHYLISEDAITQ